MRLSAPCALSERAAHHLASLKHAAQHLTSFQQAALLLSSHQHAAPPLSSLPQPTQADHLHKQEAAPGLSRRATTHVLLSTSLGPTSTRSGTPRISQWLYFQPGVERSSASTCGCTRYSTQLCSELCLLLIAPPEGLLGNGPISTQTAVAT